MKKFLYLLAIPFLLCACVGQKDDPEDPVEGPEGPEVPVGPENGSRFFRRTLALEFTATWCQYCPNMAEALEEAQQACPDRLVEIAIHYADDLAAAESDALVQQLKVSAFPTMIFDWDAGTLFNRQDPSVMTAYVDEVLAREEDACGIAVVSEVKGGTVHVSVSMIAAYDGAFSLVAALVEDDIRVTQAGAGANYPCNAVLRGFLSPGQKGKASGALQAGESFTATFSAPAPAEGTKSRVVAYILRNGMAVNVATCEVNGKSDYAYEKDD